jgi:hypothetical protein
MQFSSRDACLVPYIRRPSRRRDLGRRGPGRRQRACAAVSPLSPQLHICRSCTHKPTNRLYHVQRPRRASPRYAGAAAHTRQAVSRRSATYIVSFCVASCMSCLHVFRALPASAMRSSVSLHDVLGMLSSFGGKRYRRRVVHRKAEPVGRRVPAIFGSTPFLLHHPRAPKPRLS